MTLAEKIREELKDAMREKNQVKLDTLRAALAGFMNEAVNLGKTPQEQLTDEQALIIIRRLIKQRKDAIDQYTSGGRTDLAEAEREQLGVLEEYLPAAMPEADIKVVAERKKIELQITDKSKRGILVGAVMKEAGATADGAVVKRIVEELF